MHMFPFQSSSPWYNHNFFLNSGFVSQTCALGTSNNSWQADLVCAWRRFVAYVCMCGFGCVDAHSSVFIHLEVRGWRLMSSSFNPHLIFIMSLHMCHDTCVTIRGQPPSTTWVPRWTQFVWLSSIELSCQPSTVFFEKRVFHLFWSILNWLE